MLSSITGPGIMQNMIKEIPLQYLTPKQFKRWTASVGFSGKEAGTWRLASFSFLVDEAGGRCGRTVRKRVYHWGDPDIKQTRHIEIEGGETVRLDSVMVDKLKLS